MSSRSVPSSMYVSRRRRWARPAVSAALVSALAAGCSSGAVAAAGGGAPPAAAAARVSSAEAAQDDLEQRVDDLIVTAGEQIAAHDLVRARQTLGRAEVAVRGLSDPAVRGEQTVEIATDQVTAGDRQRGLGNLVIAVAIARRLAPADRARTLAAAGAGWAKAGDTARARQLFADALAAAAAIPVGNDTFPRDAAYAAIAQSQDQAGDTAGAEETVARISAASARDGARGTLVRQQALRHDTVAGLQTTRARSGDGSSPGRALGEMARAQCAARDFAGALQTADRIDAPRERAALLAEISGGQARAGQIPGALRTADRIGGATTPGESPAVDAADLLPIRVDALTDIARRQAEGRDVPGAGRTLTVALAAAARVPDPAARDEARRGIALAAVGAALPVLAAQTAALLVDPGRKAGTLWQIALAQERSGDRPGAMRSRNDAVTAAGAGMPDSEEKVALLRHIAESQTASADRSGASRTLTAALGAAERQLRTADLSSRAVFPSSENDRRVFVLLDRASRQLTAGDSSGARATTATARRLATALPDLPARTLVRGDTFNDAALTRAWNKAVALRRISRLQNQTGDTAGAARTLAAALTAARSSVDITRVPIEPQ